MKRIYVASVVYMVRSLRTFVPLARSDSRSIFSLVPRILPAALRSRHTMSDDYEENGTETRYIAPHLPNSAGKSQWLRHDITTVVHQHPSMRVESSRADKCTVDAPFDATTPEVRRLIFRLNSRKRLGRALSISWDFFSFLSRPD